MLHPEMSPVEQSVCRVCFIGQGPSRIGATVYYKERDESTVAHNSEDDSRRFSPGEKEEAPTATVAAELGLRP